jgi:hypothetical protein
MNGIFLLVPAFVFGQIDGVVLPDGGPFRERAAAVSQAGSVTVAERPDAVFANFIGENLPPSDKGQFHIVLYVDQHSPESRLLLRDFQAHPSLAKLREWSKFIVIDRSESPAAEARHMAQALDGADIPTVMVMASPDHPKFGRDSSLGWKYAFAGSGYGGDAALLSRNIYDGLRNYYRDHGVPVEQCPGPYCPSPSQPTQPTQPNWPPPNDNDWNVPRLPPLDESQPTSPLPSISWQPPAWVWFIAGVAAVVLLLAFRKRTAGALLLSAMLAASAVADDKAEKTEAPKPAEQIEPQGLPGPVEDAYLYPPLPRDLEWLDRSVRDEVRRAINPPKIESWLSLSLNHVETQVDSAVSGVNTAVQEARSLMAMMFWLSAIGHGVTIAAVVYLVRIVKGRR